MISLFSSKPTVTPLDDDRITVSFTIPAELLDDFSKLFESLSGFIRIIEREKRLARAKSLSQSDFQAKQAEQTKLLYFSASLRPMTSSPVKVFHVQLQSSKSPLSFVRKNILGHPLTLFDPL